MAGLFGATTASATAASTSGDISKDVTLNQPPEDGISDLAFSPQSDHLAVASWDKKVRIYEISATGQSEGKALFEHESAVLSVCWSAVRPPSSHMVSIATNKIYRMEPKSSVRAQTRRHASWT
jgi:mRNA export factor